MSLETSVEPRRDGGGAVWWRGVDGFKRHLERGTDLFCD